MNKQQSMNGFCAGCVYYPPNLPENAYPEKDYRILQAKHCSFDYQPAGQDCMATRKTSCSLVDLTHMAKTGYSER